ncbi:FAD/NAD(P)-binding protein [Pelagibacterium lacus]|uniref:FAD-dependent oxidoreductase n=1 Tax=Pelagibacterium lacus TaxID=2282655 RepID=A0A369W1M3_9HYPH|nr:FAD/NAD(P)-binding protein [Pelagibacterium lacus]RDE08584.1 FAD-dependent oxidoreductase [Pelagibacterium lacus]
MTLDDNGFVSVIVIGGGASGVLLAAHLLRDPAANVRVTIVEKSNRLGHGMAYSTDNPDHILNITAAGMSAFPDDPEHFFRWLSALDPSVTRDSFPPRARYGHYLGQLLKDLDQRADRQRLHLVNAHCEAVEETARGVEVRLDDGSSIIGHAAVLALGHEERQARGNGLSVRAGSLADTPLDPYARVMVLGSGLSMVDAWLTLAGRRHQGPIIVVSRHGLLPRAHKPVVPLDIAAADIPFGTDMTAFVDWFRRLVEETVEKGGDWRSVVDGLRPFSQKIWQSWPRSTRERFLRYVRPIWNIHRHRLPPALHERLTAAVASSQITLIAGEVIGLDAASEGEGVVAHVRRRGLGISEELEVARVYDCGGVAVNIAKSSNPVIQNLVASGKARPDPLRIGLEVTPGCAVVAADGRPSRRLFAVGPLTRGQFFEIESVPEIRVQAAMLAGALRRDIPPLA